MSHTEYRTRGVCARGISIDTVGDTIESVEFEGGCNGNLKAISKLVAGKKIDEVAEILEGNTCGPRSTSCADQLAQALRDIQSSE